MERERRRRPMDVIKSVVDLHRGAALVLFFGGAAALTAGVAAVRDEAWLGILWFPMGVALLVGAWMAIRSHPEYR